MKPVVMAFAIFTMWLMSACSLSAAQDHEADVNAALMDVLDQYQYRANLVSNLLAALDGEVNREKPPLSALEAARSQLAAIPATPDILEDPVAFQRFVAGQRQLEDSLSGLLIVIDGDRRLASDPKIRRLRGRFANVESRIVVSRDEYDQTAKQFNAALGQFPNNLTAHVFGYRQRPTFSGSGDVVRHRPPRVDFGSLRGSLRV